MTYKNAIKDCLYNLSSDNYSTDKEDYYRGLIVGIVIGLMYRQMTFENALHLVISSLPDNIAVDINLLLPDSWQG